MRNSRFRNRENSLFAQRTVDQLRDAKVLESSLSPRNNRVKSGLANSERRTNARTLKFAH